VVVLLYRVALILLDASGRDKANSVTRSLLVSLRAYK
jgi:hypothetical protein